MAEVEMHEECGVVGMYSADPQAGNENLIDQTYAALEAIQNRGRDSAGIAANYMGSVSVAKGFGSIPEALPPETRDSLPAQAAITIGQNRYATAVGSKPIDPLVSVQPFKFDTISGDLAIGHNGNLVNDQVLALQNGYRDTLPSDSWLIGALTRDEMNNGRGVIDAHLRVLPRLSGAFSLVATHGDTLIGARDPNGFRPLHLGRIAGGFILASEIGSLQAARAEEVREIEPGEMVAINEEGVGSFRFAESELRGCAFEYLYFARPDQRFNGRSVREAREEMGRQLALEAPADADVVIGVPFSGKLAGHGYRDISGLPLVPGLEKVEDIRSFIADDPAARAAIARRKLIAHPEFIAGKRVVLTDDSIVRGTSMPETVRMVRDAGATAVHVRIASPPIQWPCFYGVNMESKSELIAANNSLDEIREHLGVDSLGYLSLDGLKKAIGIGNDVCTGCFDGQYPTALPGHLQALAA